MMSAKRRREENFRSPVRTDEDTRALKFLQVNTEDESGGGWYRELDDAKIEVLTRARLERVDVKESDDAESIARGKIAEMMSKPRSTSSDKAH